MKDNNTERCELYYLFVQKMITYQLQELGGGNGKLVRSIRSE